MKCLCMCLLPVCSYVYEVEEMARATDQANLMATQSFLLARCLTPQWATTASLCEPSNLKNRILAGWCGCEARMLSLSKLQVTSPTLQRQASLLEPMLFRAYIR